MPERDRRGDLEDPMRAAAENLSADRGMRLHDLGLLLGEGAGLAQDRVRDADLADVV